MSTSISISQLQNQSSAEALRVDVRSGSEFASGHIPEAVNIPMEEIEGRLDDLNPQVPIVLICQWGTRARVTARLLKLLPTANRGSRGRYKGMDQRRPSRCSQRENALVARTPGSFGCGRDGADGCNSGADPESALGSFLRIHRPGPEFAGLTDICAMGRILEKMPWNNRSQCATSDSKPSEARS